MEKNVLITGACGGIGMAIALSFIQHGFTVYSIDLKSAEVGDDFINEIADVQDIKRLQEIRDQYSDIEFSHIVTLAGRAEEGEWQKFQFLSPETIARSVNINLTGHLNTINIFYPLLKKGSHSSITMVSSINAFGLFGLPVYSSAKAGLISFCKTAAEDFRDDQIRINTVVPGTIVTEATLNEPKDFEELLQYTNNGRFVTKEEIGEKIYTISEIETYHNGEIFVMDNGQHKNKSKEKNEGCTRLCNF